MNVQDHLWYPYLRYQEECRKAGKEDSVQEFLVITGNAYKSDFGIDNVKIYGTPS